MTPEPVDLNELEKRARNANVTGPWTWPSTLNGPFSVEGTEECLPCVIATPNPNFGWAKPTAAFIASANPVAIGQLIEAVRVMRDALEYLCTVEGYALNTSRKALARVDELVKL